jgi:hypothetical protein
MMRQLQRAGAALGPLQEGRLMKNDIDLALALAMLRKGVLVALRRSALRIVRTAEPVQAQRGLERSHSASPAAT